MPAGLAADRFGARRVTLGASVLLLLSCLLQAAPSLTALLLGRLVFGIAFGVVWTSGMAWLADFDDGGGGSRLGPTVTCSSVGDHGRSGGRWDPGPARRPRRSVRGDRGRGGAGDHPAGARLRRGEGRTRHRSRAAPGGESEADRGAPARRLGALAAGARAAARGRRRGRRPGDLRRGGELQPAADQRRPAPPRRLHRQDRAGVLGRRRLLHRASARRSCGWEDVCGRCASTPWRAWCWRWRSSPPWPGVGRSRWWPR